MPARALSAAVVISAVVVIVFAVLQYRWSNQVSEATGVRLADTLQLSMINWHLDLLRNFSELCLIVRIPSDRGAGGDLRTYVGQFAEWRAVARYPDLVSNVYLLASDDVASSRALRLDSSAQQFVPDAWSSRLAPLREAMQHDLSRGPSAMSSAGERSSTPLHARGAGTSSPVHSQLSRLIHSAIARTRSSVTPRTRMSLSLDASPETISTALGGTSSARARKRRHSSLALLSTGGAASLNLSAPPYSPATWLFEARG